MSESKQHNLDRLIREALEDKMKDCPPPPLSTTEAWNKLEIDRKELSNASKKNRFSTKIFLAVASMLIVLIMVFPPQEGAAFSRWSGMFHKVQESVVQLFGSSGELIEDKEGIPDFQIIEELELVTEQMSLTEAQSMTNFSIKVPTVSSEFQLQQVTVVRERTKNSDEIYLNYVGDERGFIVAEMSLGDQYTFGASMDSDDTHVEEILINGQQASIVTFKNGVYRLAWMTQDNYFYIEGNIPKEEIVKVAESI